MNPLSAQQANSFSNLIKNLSTEKERRIIKILSPKNPAKVCDGDFNSM
jgi:hypothetical protein